MSPYLSPYIDEQVRCMVLHARMYIPATCHRQGPETAPVWSPWRERAPGEREPLEREPLEREPLERESLYSPWAAHYTAPVHLLICGRF